MRRLPVLLAPVAMVLAFGCGATPPPAPEGPPPAPVAPPSPPPDITAVPVPANLVFFGRASNVAQSVRVATDWAKLPEAVRTGAPVTGETLEAKDLAFWSLLVPAIAPLAHPAAVATGKRLDVAGRAGLSILDVGGGR